MSDVLLYDGMVPIEEETYKEWRDNGVERVRILFAVDIEQLIFCGDMDAWNDTVDEIVGVSLTDLSYGFARTAEEDDLPEIATMVFVEGDLENSSF